MSAEEFKRQLAALSAEYRSGLPQKLAEIDALWLESSSGSGGLGPLVRALHSIAGSAGTFGAHDVGRAAAAAELFLAPLCERGKAPGPAQCSEFERLLGVLKQSATGDGT